MKREQIKELMNEADSMFQILQRLDLKPTEMNLQILTGCLGSLKFIHNTLKENLEEEPENANADV